jgi:hypothetical protein
MTCCNDTSKRSWVTTSDGWRLRLGKAAPVDSFKIMVLGKDSHLTNERRRRETPIRARGRQIVVLKFHANTRWLLAEGRAGNRGWRIRRRRRRLCAQP